MSALTQHPLSAAFPAMSPQELSDLTDDIAANGLRQPVVTYHGQVLDGWHRYQACIHAEVTPTFINFPPTEDPVAFVLSLNAQRRHLTASQRAAAVVFCQEWRPVAVKQEPSSYPPAGTTEKVMAEQAGVTTRTIRDAKAAQRGGAGDLVRDGKVSAKKGAEIAKLPAKERAEAIANPEAWQASLERKSTPKEEEILEQVVDNAEQARLDAERMADLVADYEELRRITDADDKLAEARLIIKEQRAKYEQLEGLYNAQRRELAEMTKAAKRWQRKAEGKAA